MNRAGAGAAALAALHPLDFDPDDKWDVAAGYGNYKDAHAVSVGAFYRPNEDTMFSVGGSFGGGENMVNAGVSVKLGQGNHVSTSKIAMAKEIVDLKDAVTRLEAQNEQFRQIIGQMAGQPVRNVAFPDVATDKRNMGMVFQNYAIFPHMSVKDNVAFGLRMRKVPEKEIEERVDKILKIVKIDHLKDRMPTALSGGQQQRVALARAIVIRPQVLLMDEPLSNLDAKLRIEMRNAIKQIQRRVDITTVYVTHDQEEALAVSDRIAVMNGGVICQIGRPADIYKRPKNVFVSTFIGLSNLLDGHIVKKGDKTSISFKENEDWLVDMDNLSGGVEDGEEVIISVRPEEFDMEPGTKEGIRGVIRSSVFLGLTTHYFITTGSGQELEILQTQEGHDILPDGSAVTLTVKAGRINVFRRATEETLIREEGL